MRGASTVSSGRPNCHIPEGILPAVASSFRSWPRDGASPSAAALVVQPFAAAADWLVLAPDLSIGRSFPVLAGQDRRSDGRRQRCDVFPAWRQLHVGDDRSGQRLKRGQTGIGNAQGLKQSIKTHGEARGDGTIQAKMDAQPGSHPVILLSIRARHGRRTPPDSFRSTKLCTRADAAWMERGEICVTPNISRGRRCRRPPSSKKRIDPTCSGALPACRWSQGRPPASRSWRRGHI